MTEGNGTAHDRPWRRPGALRYALHRVGGFLQPPVTVGEAPPNLVRELDVRVRVRDGTELEVNVHRPAGRGPYPVIVCAHPWGKDNLPIRKRFGYAVSFSYRVLRQTGSISFSRMTSWESPDPAWWVARGYAVVNADLRGAGASAGEGRLLSASEGEDVADLLGWAGRQPWSTGAVGLLGLSYPAATAWRAAALRPPSLRAVVPWEGFTDAYRGPLRPGGVAEVGVARLRKQWLRRNREAYSLTGESRRRPLVDDWWRSLEPDLARVEVPALICGSFSDNIENSRGAIAGFEQISSPEKHLWTHRGGRWATFYGDDALAAQLQFFDRHLRGRNVPPLPRVRLEVRESRDVVAEVREEPAWPLPGTRWTPLHLTGDGLAASPPATAGTIAFAARRSGVRFDWTLPADTEITGPIALRLAVALTGTPDACLVAGVEKWRGRSYVPFEGSYGYGRDRIATGWQRVSLRDLDPTRSRPFAPVPLCTHARPVAAGEVVNVQFGLGNSATLFRAGETLRLVVAARWLWPRNPLTGQFPVAYATDARGGVTLHWGGGHTASLLLPVVP